MITIFNITLVTNFQQFFIEAMAGKNKGAKQKGNMPIGSQAKKEITKETDFYHKHKSTIWTIAVIIVLTIFFIINNTRKVPEEGPYPPNYIKGNSGTESSQ